MGLGVDVGYLLQSNELVTKPLLSPKESGRGTTRTIRPNGLVEFVPTEISSTIRIPSQTIELSSPMHKNPICLLLDSGSIGNYISDQIVQDFDLIV